MILDEILGELVNEYLDGDRTKDVKKQVIAINNSKQQLLKLVLEAVGEDEPFIAGDLQQSGRRQAKAEITKNLERLFNE